HHFKERVVTKMRKGGRSALAWAGKALLIIALAAVARAGLPPLSFAPVDNVSLGPPGCTQDVDCSAGAIETTAGDFNNDGKLDIASANSASDDITVLLGNGAGGLTWKFSGAASGGPAGIASGLLNNDTVLDLVVTKELDNQIGVFIGHGDGTFA